MKKRIIFIAALLLLTGCTANAQGDYRETTLTESITETVTEPEIIPPETDNFDVGIFLPIVNKYEKRPELEAELRPSLEKIFLGETLLHSASVMDIPYETQPEYPELWALLDKNFAADRAELMTFFRSIYTDNYMSQCDEEAPYAELSFEERLFDIDFDDYQAVPTFKEENGGVYRRQNWGARGMKEYNIDDFDVISYDGDAAVLGMYYIHERGCGYEKMHFVYDSENGWRLDEKGDDYFVQTFSPVQMDLGNDLRFDLVEIAKKTYGAVVGPDFIFKHFNEVIEDEYIERDGEKYYRTKNYFPIENMREAFEYYICEYRWEWDTEAENFVMTDKPLLSECIEKYIDSVYIEGNGTLYRKEGAPVYEIVYPDYDSRTPVAAQIFTPPNYEDNCFAIYLCGDEKVLFAENREKGGQKLASDIPLIEVRD